MTGLYIALVAIAIAIITLMYYAGLFIGYCLYKFWSWANNAYAEYAEE